MKAIHWLFPLTIVSATCPDYATWVSQDRTPLKETLGRALPDLDFEELGALNPWYIADGEPQKGRIYKIPYDESMTVVPPASWSGSCPKTLKLDRDRKDVETYSWLRRNPIKVRARDQQAVSSPMIIVARSQEGEDEAEETQSSTATGTGTSTAPKATTTYESLFCKEEENAVEDFDLSLGVRLEFAETFCNKLMDSTLTLQQGIKEEPYGDTFIGVSLLSNEQYLGQNQVIICLGAMEIINQECPKIGGTFSTGSVLYYFLKRDDLLHSTSTPSSNPIPSILMGLDRLPGIN